MQSTRALSLRQLDTVQSYITRVTTDPERTGYAIQRVIEDGFRATVFLDDHDCEFLIAFSDRAASRLDNRYDQLVITLNLNQTNEH